MLGDSYSGRKGERVREIKKVKVSKSSLPPLREPQTLQEKHFLHLYSQLIRYKERESKKGGVTRGKGRK
jgi:hypothetical protein